ncbi:MAG: hypothetical protein PVF05_05895 [Gemmatimonadales bacterium]|jgi:sugar lactone lactonase YvrE
MTPSGRRRPTTSRVRTGLRIAIPVVAAAVLAATVVVACGDPIAVVGDVPGIMRIVAGVANNGGETEEALATDSRIGNPAGLAIAPSGELFVVETANARVSAVASNGAFRVLRADRFCSADPCLDMPTDAALGPDGLLLVADVRGRRIWQFDPEAGTAQVVAGTGVSAAAADGTPATEASIQDPRGVAVDADGIVYFSERTGHRIRYIDGAGNLQTLAGTGVPGFSGDGGQAAAAQLNTPGGLGIGAGILYVADSGNDRVRAIDLDAGTIETVAGSGVRGYTGDGIDATASALNFPEDVTATQDGRRIFIADTGNHRVRHVPLATGLIETYAGNGDPAFTGDQRDAGAVGLDAPSGVTTGPFGFLFVSDPGHDVVWRVVLGF